MAVNMGTALTAALFFMLATIAAIGGVYLVRAIKRWIRRDEGSDTFTLQDIREMKARGEISEGEYQSMRGAILGAAAARSRPVKSKPANAPPVTDDDPDAPVRL